MTLEDVTKRTFMQLSLGLGANIFAVGMKLEQFEERAKKQSEIIKERQRQYAQEMAAGNPLKVKYFVNDIIATAHELSGISERKIVIASLATFYGGFCAQRIYSQFTNGKAGSWGMEGNHTINNRKVAAATTVSASLWDSYTTVQFARVFGNPKFREYGLDSYYFEANDSLSEHPHPIEVIVSAVPYVLVAGALGFGLPAAGMGTTAALGYVGYNNLRGKETMLLAFSLGDQVEKRIAEGKTSGQIKEYLKGIKDKVSLQKSL